MKFKIGDRVINTRATAFIPEEMIGTVMQDDCVPYVKWDNGEEWARNDDYLERAKEVD